MTHSRSARVTHDARIKCALAALLAIAVAGCRPSDEISEYKVLKSRSGLDALQSVPNSLMGTPAADNNVRMIVAIASKEKAMWFFKINGLVEDVNSTEPAWREFFTNLDFDDTGNPKWDLPDGWSDIGSDNSMRYTTLQIPTEGSTLDLAISSLAPNQNLLDNVNRWRRQIGLPSIGQSEIDLQSLTAKGGKMLLFDEIGVVSGGMGAGATRQSQPKSRSIKFETPDGWTEGPASSIVKVRLLKELGDQEIRISVTEMPAAINRWEANVERWMSELGVEPENKQEFVKKNSSEVEVGGLKANRLRIVSNDSSIENGTVAIMAIRDDSAWFFKLAGPRQMVSDHEKDFDQFVDSIKFE